MKVSEECREHCSKFAACQAMIDKGMDYLLGASIASEANSGPEYEMDDGRLVSGREFFGLDDVGDETVAEWRELGNSMQKAGQDLQRILVEGCTGHPLYLRATDDYICASEQRTAIEFTEKDLQ